MSELDYVPFMREAIALAEQGRWHTCPNPTVGAVLVRDDQIVARGWHHAAGQDHAEVDCINDAAARGIDPAECTLVVTLEPCAMCAAACIHARLAGVVYGAADLQAGAVVSRAEYFDAQSANHSLWHMGGVRGAECAELLRGFFAARREE